MKIKNNIAVSENGFVFNPASGESFTTNQVGLEMLNLLRKGTDKEAIIATISEKFDADASLIEHDLNDFSEMLKQYHLHQHEES
ncbi:MAG: PqqD family protein [Bacteroidales bacterium]|nr:PqqD family protein [Bacteroidales bacterium]